jgi:hypothetical protein
VNVRGAVVRRSDGPRFVLALFSIQRLDVQGFECFVLGGLTDVLQNTQKIFFEVEGLLLSRFNNGSGACSGPRLVRTVQQSGFQVRSAAGQIVDDFDCAK